MWDLLGPGIKPVSPALTGGVLTTDSPGKLAYLNLEKREGVRGKKKTILTTFTSNVP